MYWCPERARQFCWPERRRRLCSNHSVRFTFTRSSRQEAEGVGSTMGYDHVFMPILQRLHGIAAARTWSSVAPTTMCTCSQTSESMGLTLRGELMCPFRARRCNPRKPRPLAWATMKSPLRGHQSLCGLRRGMFKSALMGRCHEPEPRASARYTAGPGLVYFAPPGLFG